MVIATGARRRFPAKRSMELCAPSVSRYAYVIPNCTGSPKAHIALHIERQLFDAEGRELETILMLAREI